VLDVGIVNYGMGNLRSIETALDHVGFSHFQISKAREFSMVRRLILPGVGGFPKAIERLKRQSLAKPIIDWAHSGKVLVGICLGMQLLFESSDEINQTPGLALMKGKVSRLCCESPSVFGNRIPNMGWRQVKACSSGVEDFTQHPLIPTSQSGNWMYFAHSYGVSDSPDGVQIATLQHCSRTYAAIVKRDNVVGFQGHPELSGYSGLRALKSALEI